MLLFVLYMYIQKDGSDLKRITPPIIIAKLLMFVPLIFFSQDIYIHSFINFYQIDYAPAYTIKTMLIISQWVSLALYGLALATNSRLLILSFKAYILVFIARTVLVYHSRYATLLKRIVENPDFGHMDFCVDYGIILLHIYIAISVLVLNHTYIKKHLHEQTTYKYSA